MFDNSTSSSKSVSPACESSDLTLGVVFLISMARGHSTFPSAVPLFRKIQHTSK